MSTKMQTLRRGRPAEERAEIIPSSLRLRRLDRALTVQDLSDALRGEGWEISRRVLSDWERGTRAAPQAVVAALSRVLKCSQRDLCSPARIVPR